MNELLRLEHISKYYENFSFFKTNKRKIVLEDINFSLNHGEILGLIGESGSGKSTLARIILALEKAKTGKIYFKNKEISLNSLKERREFYKDIQIVFQDSISATNPNLSVKEIIEEPLLHLSKLDKNQRLERIKELLNFVEINLNLLNSKAALLSGGQLQRICLARALAIKPKLIVLDEATSSIDLILQLQILKLLKKIKGKISFIFITHDIRLVKFICNRVILLNQGCIQEDIRIEKVLNFKSELGQKLQNSILPAMPKKD